MCILSTITGEIRYNSISKTVNHSGVCTPCQLCHKSNPKMKHPGQMKELAQFREVYEWLKPTINETACICLPCVKQIQRNQDKPGLTPWWLPPVPIKTCNLEDCQATVHNQTSLVTVEELEKIKTE